MNTNDNPFGNIDFSAFMSEANDTNNLFTTHNPVTNLDCSVSPVPNTYGDEQIAPFNCVHQDMYTAKKSFNPAVSAMLEGRPIEDIFPLNSNSEVNSEFSTLVEPPIVPSKKSFNPYVDALVSMQQSGAMLDYSNMADCHHIQSPNLSNPACSQSYPIPQTAPAAAPSFPSVSAVPPRRYKQTMKKKRSKPTAYDIMYDLISKIPMFTHHQKVYVYDHVKGYYRYTSPNEVEQMIMHYYRPIIEENGNGTLIEKVYKLLLKEPHIVMNDVPLSDPTKISFSNCTVNLQTGLLGPHSSSNKVTQSLNSDLARFNHQSEECPAFDNFLHDISGGDPLLEQRIWEILGYCLTPDTNAKVFFLFQGVPNSGKTLLCNLLSDFFPEEKFSALSVHSLKDQFSTGNLEEKSLCISPDLPACELDPKSASIIKQLTGNDKVSVAVKYKNNAQFRFEGKLILASNYPLLTAKPDDAFMQRAIVVPFLHAVPKDVQDKNLLDHLKAEKPAIATKALDAYFQLRRNHYCFSGNYEINSSFLYPDDLLGDTDITPLVYNFLLKNFERDPAGLVAIQSAYELFIQNTSTKVTEKMFSSVFHRLAMELFGANKTRSYHSGTYQNARSSIAGIRFK